MSWKKIYNFIIIKPKLDGDLLNYITVIYVEQISIQDMTISHFLINR